MVELTVQSRTEIVVGSAEKKLIRVLHVDDEVGLLEVAKQCLELQGPFEVDTACSVEEALVKLENQRYDAVVSDYQMPGKDGLQFLETLRKNGNNIPFIIFTGKGREEIAGKALNLGADQYLNKNGDPETVYGELAHGIIGAVERMRAKEELRESERKLRILFEESATPILVVNENGEYTDANQAALNFLECTKDELLCRHVWDFSPSGSFENQKMDPSQFLKACTVEIDHLVNGKVKTLLLNVVPIETSEGTFVYGIGQDITERKRLEKTLWESRKGQNTLRKSGINVVGDVSWGTHICQFYETKQDMIDVLVPYFAEGLRNNEFCMWVTSESLSEEEAKEAMRKAMPDFDEYDRKGQMEIVPYTEWYVKDGTFDLQRVLNAWIQRLSKALADGYEGMRITGNTAWLENKDWDDFADYERQVNEAISEHRMIAVCTYSLDRCGSAEIIDVVAHHQLALFKRKGKWMITENSETRQRREALEKSQRRLQKVFDASPDAIIVLGLNGDIVECSQATLKLHGYTSKEELIGKNVSILFSEKDRETTLRNLKGSLNEASATSIECILSTRNGRLFPAQVSASVIQDSQANPVGYIIIAKDMTAQKKAEQEILKAAETWQKTFDAISDFALVVDKDFKIMRLNRALCELLKKDPEELVGKRCFEVLHGTDRPWPNCPTVETLRTGETATAEVVDPHIGKPLLVTNYPLFDENGRVSACVHVAKDVGLLKESEKALREHEAVLSAIIENTSDSVWSIDNEGRLLFANTAFKRQFSLVYGVEPEEGMNLAEIVPKTQIPFWVETHNRALKGGRFSFEQKLEIKGVTVDVEISANPIVNERGEITGVTYFSRDITCRKKTVTSEQPWKILFESAPDGIYLSDVKGTFIDGNRAAEEITGFKREELIGKSFLKLGLLPKREIPKAVALLARNALGKSTGPDEVTLRRKDGTEVVVEIRTFPMKTQDGTVVLGIARDVTDRIKIQNMMKENQAKFKALFVGSPEAGVFVDRDFRVLDVNPRFEELFGYSLAEVKGKHINDVVVPNDKRKEAEALDSHVIRGYAHQNTWRRRKDGVLVPVSVSAAPVTVEDRLAGYVCIYADISELKNIQRKLEMMNEKLRVVGGLTRHDVRNKLSAITGNIYLHKKKLADRPDVLEGFSNMQAACEQIVRILEFSRDYERLGIEELSFVDVETTIGKAAGSFSDLKGAKIVNECHGLTVLADSLLERLFYNLIDNSLKHGGKITKIRIHHEESQDQLRLIYEDDGVGIPKENKAKLFTEGFTTGKGSGYGLYLIRRMVETYGWTIEETGTSGKGAEFTINIPKIRPDGRQNYKLGWNKV